LWWARLVNTQIVAHSLATDSATASFTPVNEVRVTPSTITIRIGPTIRFRSSRWIATSHRIAPIVASLVAFGKNHWWNVDDSWASTEATRFLAVFGHSSWPIDRISVTTKRSSDVLAVRSVILSWA